MKRITLICAFGLIALSVLANYYVFSLTNRVERKGDNGWFPLVQGEQLIGSDSIRMEHYASLSIVDDKNEKVYAIQSTNPQSVSSLIKQSQRHSRWLAQSWAVVKAILFGDELPQPQQLGVIYRDSKADEAVAGILQQRLNGQNWTAHTNLTSNGRIEIRLVDMNGGNMIDNVIEGDWVKLLVSNHSNQSLYITAVDIDETDNVTVILPTDITEVLQYQFIPPLSTVMLPYPIAFSPKGRDGLFVIGYPEPFDMENVLKQLSSAHSQEGNLYIGSIEVPILSGY